MNISARSIDITPQHPVFLGASGRPLRFTEINDRLEATVITFKDHQGTKTAMVGLDLLYPSEKLRKSLEHALRDLVPPERLWLSASHTHRAPMIDETKPLLGASDEGYISTLARKLIRTTRELLTSNDAAGDFALTVHNGTAYHGINRRLASRYLDRSLSLKKRMRMAPNPAGPIDPTILIAVMRAANDRPVAVIWNYACHPVGHFSPTTVSAHFPGIVRNEIRTFFADRALPVFYLQGFSGDIRPRATAKPNSILQQLERRLRGPRFFDMSPASYSSWSASVTQSVTSTLTQPGSQSVPEQLDVIRHTYPTKLFVKGADQERQTSFHLLRFDDLLGIVGVSAEVVSEYSPFTRNASTAKFTMCVGCIDDTFGYAPTTEMLKEGGYEAGEYCTYFSLDEISPQIETAVKSGILAVTQSVDTHGVGISRE